MLGVFTIQIVWEARQDNFNDKVKYEENILI